MGYAAGVDFVMGAVIARTMRMSGQSVVDLGPWVLQRVRVVVALGTF